MAILSPAGILLPIWFRAGDAWGEWSVETVKEQVGFEPAKMKIEAELYKAPIPDYTIYKENESIFKHSIAYIFSAFVGMGIILLITFGLYKFAKNKNDSSVSSTT